MTAIISRLLQYSTLRLILAMWVVVLLSDLMFIAVGILADAMGILDVEQMSDDFLDNDPLLLIALFLLVLAPIIETLLFQWALLLLVKKLTEWLAKSDSWIPAFLTASLVFAAVHAGNAENAYSIHGLLRAVVIIPAGLAFTMLAIVERERERGFPVLSVMLLHSLANVLPFIAYTLPE